MPPKISYTKELIIDAAVRIVQSQGIDKLNARNLAKEIGGSTQPIYRVFESIKDVEDAVIEKLTPYVQSFLLVSEDPHSDFLSIGLGYMRLSQQEPHLFSLFFTSGKKKWDLSAGSEFLQSILKKMRSDYFLQDLSDKSLIQLFSDMFIYTHGLCTLNSIKKDKSDPEDNRRLLQKTGEQLILMTILREQHPELIENLKRNM